MKFFVLILISFINLFCLIAQNNKEAGNYFITNFSPKEYKGHIQNWDFIEDNRGVIYVANGDGILEYDGINWRLIMLTNEGSAKSFAKDSHGRIYVGGYGEFGYLAPDKTGLMLFVSLRNLLPEESKSFTDINDVIVIGEDVFFRSVHCIFRYRNKKIKTWLSDDFFVNIFSFKENLYVISNKEGLLTLKNENFEIINKTSLLKDPNLFFIDTIQSNLLLFRNKITGKLITYNASQKGESATAIYNLPSFSSIKSVGLYAGTKSSSGNLFLGTITSGCYVFDQNKNMIEQINSRTGLSSDGIYKIFFDKHDNIWMGLNNGISMVEYNSPITFWNETHGLKGNIFDIIRYKGVLYVSTDNGIIAFIEKQSNPSKFELVSIKNINVWTWKFAILKTPEQQDPVLLVCSNQGIFKIDNFKGELLRSSDFVYYLKQSTIHPEIIFACDKDGMSLLNYKNNKFVEYSRIPELKDVRTIYEEKNGNLWAGTFRDGYTRVFFEDDFKKNRLEFYKSGSGLPSIKNAQVYPFKDSCIFCTNKGIYKFNTISKQFSPDSSFGTEFCSGAFDIFHFCEDQNKNIWLSSLNNFQGKIGYGTPLENGVYAYNFSSLKRLPDMMVFSIYFDANNIVWICGSEGLFRYNKTKDITHQDFNTLIRKVFINNDSVLFNGVYDTNNQTNKLRLSTSNNKNAFIIDYVNNSITFQYTSSYFVNSKENQFKHYLKGYDNDWSQWSKQTQVQYTNLSEGKYCFKVASRTIYGEASTPAEFDFLILPPWYRNKYAYFGYFLVFVVIMYISNLLYSKRLIRKNLQLEHLIKDRTEEIRQQKEEISSQAHQLERTNSELEKLSIVARETDNAVAIMDRYGNYEWVNAAFKKLYNIKIQEFIENRTQNIIQSSTNKNIKKLLKDCITFRKPVLYESHTFNNEGKKIWLHTSLTPILEENGSLYKIVAIETEITKIKESESKIEIQNEELKKLNETKDRFFSIIAHDLQNPFNALVGFSEFLVLRFQHMNIEKVKEYHQLIHQTAKQGFFLLQNLLDWSRAQSGSLKFEPEVYNLFQLTVDSIELLTGSAAKKGIELNNFIINDIEVFTDYNMTSTVIRNLIANSIKFTPTGGKISITAEKLAIDEPKKSMIEVCVQDSGIGIHEKDIPKLFIFIANLTTKGTDKEKGTGLGLVLCKEFVERCGGQIRVESQLNIGAKFIFTIPKG